ncbi:MAG: hypothetical protein SFU86_10495 [Pirellulaceae bacterium]|nr:hypothetical protein [Pirellulaceae bacterium]
MKRLASRLVAVALLAGPLTATLSAQVAVVNPGWQGGAQWANPLGSSLGWLSLPQLQKDLEIVPEQKAELDKLRTEVMGKVQAVYKLLSEGEPAERTKKYTEAAKALGDETEQRVREILLPHQIKRLGQIELQQKLSYTGYGSAQALASEAFAKELAITDEQKEQLKAKEAELQKEIREKTAEFMKQLNDDSREKLLSVLTPAQREKLQALLGDKFDWQTGQGAGAVIRRAP